MGLRVKGRENVKSLEIKMAKFRFQDLKIWHSAIEIANELFDIADDLEKKEAISLGRTIKSVRDVNVQ